MVFIHILISLFKILNIDMIMLDHNTSWTMDSLDGCLHLQAYIIFNWIQKLHVIINCVYLFSLLLFPFSTTWWRLDLDIKQMFSWFLILECPLGHYGEECRHICQCQDANACNKVTGECSLECPAGYTGEACERRKSKSNRIVEAFVTNCPHCELKMIIWSKLEDSQLDLVFPSRYT